MPLPCVAGVGNPGAPSRPSLECTEPLVGARHRVPYLPHSEAQAPVCGHRGWGRAGRARLAALTVSSTSTLTAGPLPSDGKSGCPICSPLPPAPACSPDRTSVPSARPGSPLLLSGSHFLFTQLCGALRYPQPPGLGHPPPLCSLVTSLPQAQHQLTPCCPGLWCVTVVVAGPGLCSGILR